MSDSAAKPELSNNVIRWHDHDRAAKCWATEAKYRRMVANGIIPAPVSQSDDLVGMLRAAEIINSWNDTSPCEYVAPPEDSA